VILTILTDGYENASREFTADQVREMIEGHEDWAFNFVGAGIDAWDVSSSIGIHIGSASYTDPVDIGVAMAAIGGMSAGYAAATREEQVSLRENFYRGKKDIGKSDDA